jgi:hypothetical protein
MLPNSNNRPAACPQASDNTLVSLHIDLDSLCPKSAVRFWHFEMNRTTVPKAAIDENDNSLASKCEIRVTG